MNARGLRALRRRPAARSPPEGVPRPTTSRPRRSARPSTCRRPATGADAPRAGIPADLHRGSPRNWTRRAAPPRPSVGSTATRRQVIVGTSAAAAAAVAAVAVDRLVVRGGNAADSATDASRDLTPNDGPLAARRGRAPTCPRAACIRSISARSSVSSAASTASPRRVSGVCTHQGCRLWFDAPDDRLRCPCHSTSFSPRRARC